MTSRAFFNTTCKQIEKKRMIRFYVSWFHCSNIDDTLETGVAGVDWRSDGMERCEIQDVESCEIQDVESCEIQDVAGMDDVND